MAADRTGQRAIFAELVFKLRIFHIIIALLKEYEEIDANRVTQDIASALPYDNPVRTFKTTVAWGRYAGLVDYNAKTRKAFVPSDDDCEKRSLRRLNEMLAPPIQADGSVS